MILNCTTILRPYWCSLQLLNEQNKEITLEEFSLKHDIKYGNYIFVHFLNKNLYFF
jgi:hypothetical protein